MLPYEYSVLLKTFKKLGIPQINVYLEASAIAEPSLNGKVHKVKHYFNKRFYKRTEECTYENDEDIESLFVAKEGESQSKTLFGFEGCMLPSKTEIRFAKKGKFDLYTITNLSFMDLALAMKIKPNLYAISKGDLALREEPVEDFSNIDLFKSGDVSLSKTDLDNKDNEADSEKYEIKYDA